MACCITATLTKWYLGLSKMIKLKTDLTKKWAKQVEDDFWTVAVEPYDPSAFELNIKRRNSGNYVLFHILVDAHKLIRANEHILRSEITDLLIIYICRGKCDVHYGGKSFGLMPTNICIVNGWEPYSLDFDGTTEMLVFRMPISAFETRGKENSDRVTFRKITTETGLARISAMILEETHKQLTQIPHNQDRMLFNNIASVICAGLQDVSNVDEERSNYHESLIRKIRRFIEDNIEEESLNAEMIAKAHNISVRYLNKIFEAEPDTAIQYIRSLRLRLFAQRLMSDKSNLTIKEIVFSCGFSDYAHFHRAFKKHFQCTPNEYRNRFSRIS